MNKVLSFIITAKNKTAEGLSGALGGVKSFAKSVFTNLVNVQAGFQMLQGAAQKLWSVLKASFHYETLTVQFKTLIGSMDEARAHMQMLKELGDTPPFSLDEFAKASRSLMVMTDNALGFKGSLELVGDAAAATGQPLETLAHEVGRAYAVIRDGQPISRAVMGLRNMGAITPEVAAKLDDMQKAGASNYEMWQVLEEQLKRFKGAMEQTEQTGDGLIGAIGSRWDNAVRAFGDAFMDVAKDALTALLDKMKQLEEDGTIAVWADKMGQAMKRLAEFIKPVASGIATVVGWYGKLQDFMETAGDMVGAYIGTGLEQTYGTGGSSKDAWKNIGDAWKTTLSNKKLDAEIDAEHEAEVRAKAVEKAAKAKVAAEKKAEEEAAKIKQQMDEAQARNEARAAEKAAEKKAKEDAKAAEKTAQEAERLREREKNARIKTEQKIAREKQRLAESDLRESEKSEAEAERRLTEARSQTARAWGWYRDKDTMQAEIDERKAQADTEKQWEKDFERLKSKRRDWRSIEFGKLSADEEAVRQVALAKEEEQAAQKALDEISENTAYLKDIAEALSAGDEG